MTINYKMRGRKRLRSSRIEHTLRLQADQIDKVFYRREIPTQVNGGSINKQVTNFNLGHSIGIGLEKLLELTHELRAALKVPNIRFVQDHGHLKLSIDHHDDSRISLLDLMEYFAPIKPLTAVLGLTEDGRPVFLDFDAPEVSHILITGKSGAGKTNILTTIAISLAAITRQSKLQFIVIDLDEPSAKSTKNSSKSLLKTISYLPHVLSDVCHYPEEARTILEILRGELIYRKQQNIQEPTIVLLIDNFGMFFKMENLPLLDDVREILQGGTETGIHLVISIEQPNKLIQDNLFRANIPVRLVGETSSEDESKIATGITDSRAEYLLGKGDFLAVAGGGIQHFQAAFVNDYDLHYSLQLMRSQNVKSLVAQPINIRKGGNLPDFENSSKVREGNKDFLYDGREIIFR